MRSSSSGLEINVVTYVYISDLILGLEVARIHNSMSTDCSSIGLGGTTKAFFKKLQNLNAKYHSGRQC